MKQEADDARFCLVIFPFLFFSGCSVSSGRTGEPGEHVVDRTVGWYAYGNMFWWLYLNLELGLPDDISELHR